MSTGNPVNNQIFDDQQPLAPAAQPDPAMQQQGGQANQQQGPISVGSPEAGPMTIAQPESNNASPEYGYEELKRLEQSPESIAGAERKEGTHQQPQQQQQIQTKTVQKPAPTPPPAPQGPKVFGYSIPPSLLTNFQSVAKSKSKGNPKDSSTWVVMLLDRILKKQKGS
ncbi:hypothetical protein KC909_02660 [Candidatus Dojkabacteria bacterium]|uniref:Uncharacterized protein n=1 Tax=Candidatus Dojkabacteria bacterium TaxID=2099670 RepID=A0A955L5E9_9BACT|nr:hypothetical protein [Candidatus Dojkabacteria bacterium]